MDALTFSGVKLFELITVRFDDFVMLPSAKSECRFTG